MSVNDGFQEAVITEDDIASSNTKTEDTKGTPQATIKDSEKVVPDYVPEKFRNSEDPLKAMADAYHELEKKLSGKPDPKKEAEGEAPKEEENKTPEENPEAPKEMSPQLKSALELASGDYFKSGEISTDSRKALNDIGISDQYIDQYVNGFKASEAAILGAIHEEAGGEERLTDILKWAGENLSKTEIASLDNILQNSNDINVIKNTVAGLNAKYRKAVGQEPNNIRGGRSQSAGDTFTSEAEVIEAMSDPRYRKGDKKYIKSVEDKLARSHEIFTSSTYF